MDFKILGPLEIIDGERVILITARKQLAVIAVLLMQANRVVSLDRIIDELWGEEPPPTAAAALQAYVSNLRRVLEPDRPPRSPAQLLVSKPPGYMLIVDLEHYDAARFAARVSTGQARLAEGRPQAAREAFDDALGMWRGPALADFADEPFAQTEAARLEELRVTALEARAEADLALGHHAEAVAELETLVHRHPLREALWESYLVGLYRAGRQADALRAYQACRRVLGEELGIDPGPALRALEGAILRQDPELDWQPPLTGSSAGAPAPQRPPTPPAAAVPASRSPGGRTAMRDVPMLVGRRTQLERLERVWSEAATGTGRIALVTGEAGIGKTRLVDALVDRVAATGASVAWGRCDEDADVQAYWPWAQVVRTLLDAEAGNGRDVPANAGSPSAASLAELVHRGSSSEPPPLADPGAARFQLFQAVAALVEATAAQRRLLVVLDDLHWADVASLQLLRFLDRELRDAPVLLVATYRDTEVTDDHPLVETLGSLAGRPGVERVMLDGLNAEEVSDLVAATVGHPATPEVTAALHERTGGNPFFVGELSRLLEAEGALTDRAAARVVAVPAGVRDVVRRRLARLPDQTRALIAIASVAGWEFRLAVLEATAGLDGDALFDALEPALISGMIVQDATSLDRFRFSHALVRETIYEGLTGLRRSRLHARIADALETLVGAEDHDSALELAHHLWQAGPSVPPERALAALLRAVEASIAGLAYEHAEELLRRVLELIRSLPAGEARDRQELWAQVRLGMVRATTKGQSSPGAQAAFTRARELCGRVTEPPEQLPALYGLVLVAWFQLQLAEASDYATQLLEVARRDHDPRFLVAGHLASGLLAFERGELAAARHHLQRATATADSLRDPGLADVLHGDPSVSARCFEAFVLALAGLPAEAAALLDEGLDRARQAEHPWSIAVALVMRAWVASVVRDLDRAGAMIDDAATYVSERGFGLLTATTTSLQGWVLAIEGDTNTAVQLVEEGLRGAVMADMRLMRTYNLALVAEVQARAGRRDQGLATVDQGLAQVEMSGERFYEAELHRLRGELLAERGPDAASEAAASLARAVEVARAQGATLLEDRASLALDRLLGTVQAGRKA